MYDKRYTYKYAIDVPGTTNLRRTRSALNYICQTSSEKTATDSNPISVELEKIAAIVVFIDLDITGYITEKGRTYPASFVILIK